MNNSDTLSVDPGRATLGALHPEFDASFLRGKVSISRGNINKSKRVVNLFFAVNPMHSNAKGAAMLLLRWALASLLIVSGSFILSGEIYAPVNYIPSEIYALFEIVIGGMLVFGMLTRIAMGVATIGFATVATMSVIHGVFNLEALMCCMSCLVFLIFGPGKFSCDFLIRKAIVGRDEQRQRNVNNQRISYRAFRYAN